MKYWPKLPFLPPPPLRRIEGRLHIYKCKCETKNAAHMIGVCGTCRGSGFTANLMLKSLNVANQVSAGELQSQFAKKKNRIGHCGLHADLSLVCV